MSLPSVQTGIALAVPKGIFFKSGPFRPCFVVSEQLTCKYRVMGRPYLPVRSQPVNIYFLHFMPKTVVFSSYQSYCNHFSSQVLRVLS
jgi:hypothetical protein